MNYDFTHSLDWRTTAWSGTFQLRGTDQYTVLGWSPGQLILKQVLRGSVVWPTGTVTKVEKKYFSNSTESFQIEQDEFMLRNVLTFSDGVLTEIGDDGCYEVSFHAADASGAWLGTGLGTPSDYGEGTVLFLVSPPSIGDNITTGFGSFLVSYYDHITVGEARRDCIVATFNETIWPTTKAYTAFWDAQTGILLRLLCTAGYDTADAKASESLNWSLRDTNIFQTLAPPTGPRLTCYASFNIVNSTTVFVSYRMTATDVVNRSYYGMKIRKDLSPSNFSAYDEETGVSLPLDIDYASMKDYVVIFIIYPRTVAPNETYSFRFSHVYENAVHTYGEWDQLSLGYSVFYMGTDYFLAVVLPPDSIGRIELSFVRSRGVDSAVPGTSALVNGTTAYSFVCTGMVDGDFVSTTISFRRRKIAISITTVDCPSKTVVNARENVSVRIRNGGDDVNLTVSLTGSGVSIYPENVTAFLPSGAEGTLNYTLTGGRPGEGRLEVVAYRGATEVARQTISIIINQNPWVVYLAALITGTAMFLGALWVSSRSETVKAVIESALKSYFTRLGLPETLPWNISRFVVAAFLFIISAGVAVWFLDPIRYDEIKGAFEAIFLFLGAASFIVAALVMVIYALRRLGEERRSKG
jgi:hypothetical protein